jgi:hypothetical protein
VHGARAWGSIFLLAAVLAAGCAGAPPAADRLEAPYTRTFGAALRAVAPAPVERAEPAEGRIVTGYAETLAPETRGYLLEAHLVERRRFDLHLWPEGASTGVEVSAVVERRAPGGAQSIRWERVDPVAAERELLDRVREELKKE